MQAIRTKSNLTDQQRETFKHLVRKGNLATLPMVAQKLIEISRDDNVNFVEFAKVIQSDQGLAARILRVANSAYYGLRIKATTLERAITALGLKYVRSICLGFHLMAAMNRFEAIGFSMVDFWKISLIRAVFARQIALRYCPKRSEEAFLVGLLQDCGIPFLVETLGEPYIRLWRNTLTSQASLYQLEKKLFEIDHLVAITGLMEHWGMPDILAIPITTHHQIPRGMSSRDEIMQLAQIGYFCGNLSFNNPEKISESDLQMVEYPHLVFNLDREEMIRVFADVRSEYGCLIKLYQGIVPEKINISDLLSQAHRMLIEDVDGGERRVVSIDEEMREYELSGQDEFESHQRDQYDPVTGLESHSVLIKYLDLTLDQIRTTGGDLTMIQVDIDNLKEFNRQSGVKVGDTVLKKVASLLSATLGKNGRLFRGNGDDLLACVPKLSFQEVFKAIQLFLAGISKMESPSRQKGISVSAGMVHCIHGACAGCSERLLELTDNQMYQAKLRGSNQISYQVMGK